MQLTLSQSARTDLHGPSFFALLHRFCKEPLAVLYSAHHQGQSVIASIPLVTLSAADEHSPLNIHCTEFPPPALNRDSHVLLHQWESALDSIHLDSHSPLTAWIGQVGYDIARTLENIGTRATNDLRWPILHWRLFDEYYLLDHASNTWTIVTTDWKDRPQSSDARLDQMAARLMTARLMNACSAVLPPVHILPGELVAFLPRADYLEKVRQIKEFIAAGDIFQANFAQRWEVRTTAGPIDIFRQLMRESPSAYASLLIFDDKAAISASPELFLHREGHHLITRPIKGTRPRDLTDASKDAALRDELLLSLKDQAELAMIVDLLRNDLGRLARYGSVQVTHPRELEMHPTVWHAVATIEADLAGSDRPFSGGQSPMPGWAAILRALMPGGSITGVPKIRAMQIIEQLEPHRRGLYCGAIGSIAPNAGTLNIAIRTIQLIGNQAYLHAGGAIVADSDPEEEYEETLHKAAALFRTLGVKNSE